jgi:hypothetical protein
MQHFIEAAASGLLRGRPQNILPAIGAAFFEQYWNVSNWSISDHYDERPVAKLYS